MRLNKLYKEIKTCADNNIKTAGDWNHEFIKEINEVWSMLKDIIKIGKKSFSETDKKNKEASNQDSQDLNNEEGLNSRIELDRKLHEIEKFRFNFRKATLFLQQQTEANKRIEYKQAELVWDIVNYFLLY